MTLKTKYGFKVEFSASMKDKEKCAVHASVMQQLKTHIDSLNNSQMMDALRLQSLATKRNEAFEVMTNFIKKMAESRASILGNMRLTEDENDPVLKTSRAFDARMLAAVASAFIQLTENASYTQETLADLLATSIAIIGKDKAVSRLAEPLQLVAEILGKDLATFDAKVAQDLIERAAQGSFAGAITAFADHELAVKMSSYLAVGMSKGLASHKDASVFHEKMAKGHMQALIAIAGKAAGTSENPHAGNDAVRIAITQMLEALKTALSSQASLFSAYHSAALATVKDADLSGEGKEVMLNPFSQVMPAP